jgi:hypothetical protein
VVGVGVGVAHTLGSPEQVAPASIWHVLEHPSLLVALPSSHDSPEV